MDKSRRRLLQGAAAAGGVAAFAAGYAEPLEKLGHGLSGSSGEKPANNIYGNAHMPEFTVDLASGELVPNPDQRIAFTVCYGCTTKCGVRVRIDNATDKVIRVAGNPYNPLSADEHLDQQIPVREALLGLSRFNEKGQHNRATACGRGNAAIGQIESEHRVLHVMKRSGPRGSGQWQTISFEKAIEEIVEGGDLFGEGPVEGLRAINDYETLIDPDNPEYGPKTNQLLVMEATDYGRSALLKRFTFNAFGTRNYGNHGSYCGLAFRLGSGAVMNDMDKYAHLKPDFANAKFALMIGTAPSQAGNPFKRMGRQIAQARAKGDLDYVIVDPALNASVVEPAGKHANWVPVRPGTDTALAMGLIRWLLENDGYAGDFLAIPSQKAAEAAGEVGHTNATHLVVTSKDHPRAGHFLRRSDLGQTTSGAQDDAPMVWSNGALAPASETDRAELFADLTVTLPDSTQVSVKSSLTLLREAALEQSMQDYADACGVPVKRIADIARRFKAGGRQAVADGHGGMMSGTGFYATFGVQLLNVLAGSINHAGGAAHGGGSFNGTGEGPRYNLKKFPNMRKPKGLFLSRSKFPYEKSSEFKRKKEAGENPYPATAPWRSLAPPTLTEHLSSALDGYPYPIKAVIGCMINPLYGQAGLSALISDKLADPKKLGLYVAVDGFINETNRYADYIIPDSVMYEVWGFTGAWAGNLTKMTTACWPVVEPRQQKTADGLPISVESFVIAVAKRLGLSGFGDQAIPAADKTLLPLNSAEDFYLRAAANIAYLGDRLPDASEDDIALSGMKSLLPKIEAVLPAEERGAVANLYSRGGRFQPYKAAYNGEHMGNAWKRTLCIYNEDVGTAIDSQTGQKHRGVPHHLIARMADGTPMREVYPESEWPLLAFSFKSNLMNSYAAGLDRLRMIKPYNPVLINAEDAAFYDIAYGDLIEIESPGGKVIGIALTSPAVMRGALGIEHGFGHKELGAAAHTVDGKTFSGNPWIGAGVSLNDLGFADPTRKIAGTWLEPVSGAAVRQGLPIRVKKHAEPA